MLIELTWADLKQAYEKRAEEVKHLNAIIQWSPYAEEEAAQLDAERKAGRVRGPLHVRPSPCCRPVLN